MLGDMGGRGSCSVFGVIQLLFQFMVNDDLFLILGQIVYVRCDSLLASCFEFDVRVSGLDGLFAYMRLVLFCCAFLGRSCWCVKHGLSVI